MMTYSPSYTDEDAKDFTGCIVVTNNVARIDIDASTLNTRFQPKARSNS